MLKIMLLDNEPVFADALKIILEAIPKQRVVAVINSVNRVEEDCMKHKPDVIIMRDFLFYEQNGFSAAAKVKKSFPEIKIILVISFPKEELIKKAQLSGADSCLLASDRAASFHTCLWETMKGKRIFPKSDTKQA